MSLHWVDEAGKDHDETLGNVVWEDAWRMAGRKEAELEGTISRRYLWKEFREKFEAIYYQTLKPSSIAKQKRALDIVAEYIHPTYLDEVTTSALCEMAARINQSVESIRSNLGHIRAAVRWAKRMQMIRELPEIQLPRGKDDPSKGRPLTTDEVQSMIEAVPMVRHRTSDVEKYQNLIRGIVLCGMRIEEIVTLEWNSETAGVSLDTSRDHQWQAVYKKQKGRRKTVLPILPDCQKFFESLPRREGRVFRIENHPHQCSKVLCQIGEAAGIVVVTDSRHHGGVKYASAHDLRRSFAARWAEVLPESILAAIMRHRSPETTRKHYAIMDAERILHAVEEATRRRGEQ